MAASVTLTENGRMAAHATAETKGLSLVVGSAVAYGTMPILAKLAYAEGLSTTTLLAYRFVLATALFAAFSWRAPALPWRQRLTLWGLGTVFVGNALLYFSALHYAPAAIVSLILYAYPVIVTLLAPLFGLERLRTRGVLAAVLAFAGCALTAAGTGAAAVGLRGIALTLAAAFVYALYVVLGSRFATGIPTEAAAAHVSQVCAVFFVVAGAVGGGLGVPATPTAWAVVIAIAAVCTVFALRAFLAGLARIGPARAAVASSLEVLVTILLAVVFLGERIGARAMVGGALILGAVALHNLRPQWRRRAGGEGGGR